MKKMLKFKLIDACYQNASKYNDNYDDVDFLLEENNWNDYHYYTTYHLHVTPKLDESLKGILYLGQINIMKLGQQEKEMFLLRKALKGRDVFENIPDDFYSITFSIDIFKGLLKYLKSKEERESFIKQLHVILKETDDYYNIVKDDAAFKISLMRNSSMNSYPLLKGLSLLEIEGKPYNLRKHKISVRYVGTDEDVTLDFSGIKTEKDDSVSNGVVAFIGKNGSGKSTALYKLASLLYSSPGDRERYLEKTVGSIKPKDIGISQLMIFSYSPFDNFMFPGEYVRTDLLSLKQAFENNTQRFVYCGFRDIKSEVDYLLEHNIEDNDSAQESCDIQSFRLNYAYHKTQDDIAEESKRAYGEIMSDAELLDTFKKMMKTAEIYQKDLYDIICDLDSFSSAEQRCFVTNFKRLSTGHQFFVHTMLHIIAYCENDALLLFDEPENHLQAPLLSFMMKEIKKILLKRNSVMLIATHSPIVLQEVIAKNVKIVRRIDNKTTFSKPKIETFGASFGEISTEVFDMNSDRMSFFDTLDIIYDELHCSKKENAKDVVDSIKEAIGGISSQTIQYVVTKYITEKQNNNVEN